MVSLGFFPEKDIDKFVTRKWLTCNTVFATLKKIYTLNWGKLGKIIKGKN